MKYNWHLLKFKQLKEIVNDTADEHVKADLENRMDFHEKTALNYIMKC